MAFVKALFLAVSRLFNAIWGIVVVLLVIVGFILGMVVLFIGVRELVRFIARRKQRKMGNSRK